MFLKLFQSPPPPSHELTLVVAGREVLAQFISNRRARRYILRLQRDGSARVTIPRGGSMAEGQRFLERNRAWLEQALQRRATQPPVNRTWTLGTAILFRGESLTIERAPDATGRAVRFGPELVSVAHDEADLRPAIEKHLWRLAAREFPARVFSLAAQHRLTVHRVTVRNQRSRWGSCSRRATISLNWRLIQTPLHVQDYIILHELMHLRQMNHSARFWREVQQVCPEYETAERWLKQHAGLLR